MQLYVSIRTVSGNNW